MKAPGFIPRRFNWRYVVCNGNKTFRWAPEKCRRKEKGVDTTTVFTQTPQGSSAVPGCWFPSMCQAAEGF